MKFATATLLSITSMSSMDLAFAQCEFQDNALGTCLDRFLWSEESCENCLVEAALQNAGGLCASVQSNVCGQISTRCPGVCGAGMQRCASQINAKVNCELNDQRTTELRLGTCTVSCNGANAATPQMANPAPSTTFGQPTGGTSPVSQPTSPWSWSVSAPAPTPIVSFSSSNVRGDTCFRQDSNLGACLDNLFGVNEAVCELCVDKAALRLAGDACASGSLCTELQRCTSQCGGYSCWNQILAKATYERNDQRTTELRIGTCPALTCSSAGSGTVSTSGSSVSSSSTGSTGSSWGRSWTWFDQPSGEESSGALACTSILILAGSLLALAFVDKKPHL